jgi:hypothetical protein
MFRIRVFTPALLGDDGLPHAGAELRAGESCLRFRVDLTYWRIADYERQWKQGIARLAHGAAASALMARYAGPRAASHALWALWRDGGHVYVQSQCILSAELETPFDPTAPYEHVGQRVPATENGLPLPEWRVEAEQLFAAAFQIRWPFGQ